MKFSLFREKVIFLSLLLFCVSCGDADFFDTDKWSSQIEDWEPGLKVQVAHGEFTLWDLINQGRDSVIIKEGNNLSIQYIEDNIYVLPVDSVFSMPVTGQAFEVALPPLSIPTGVLTTAYVTPALELTTELPDIPNNCELNVLVLSGSFFCRFPYAGFDYHAKVEFRNIEENGDVFTIEKDITSFDQKGSWIWNQAKIELNGTRTLTMKLVISIKEGVNVVSSSTLSKLQFQLTNLEFEIAEGKILVAPVKITPGSFNMNVDFLDEIGGDFKFTKPELSLIVKNEGIGVPVELQNISFENKGVLLKLNEGSALSFQGNPLIGSFMTEIQSLNKDNSNIVDFLSMPPSGEIFYKGNVEVNPGRTADNKVYKGGKMCISARVRIPFSLIANQLTYSDTLTDIDIDEKIGDKIKEGNIWINADNGIRLALSIPSLVLLDERGIPLDTVWNTGKENVIPAAAANGNAQKGAIKFELKEKQAKKLSQTKNILLKAIASTPGDESIDISSESSLSFHLSMEVKAKISDFDDF